MAFPDLEALQAYLDRCTNPRHFTVHENGLLQAWLCSFDRNDSRWFVMIIDTRFQGNGLGTALLTTAMSKEEALNGWVVEHDNYRLQDRSTYRSPLGFYLKLGFHLQPNRFDDGELQAINSSGEEKVEQSQPISLPIHFLRRRHRYTLPQKETP